MYGLDNASGVNVMPKLAPASSATPLWFTEGGAGLAASYPGQDWFNMVQAELLNVLTAGGVKPEKGKLTQLADAIQQIIKNANLQPLGNYASGELFFKATNYVGMQTEKKNYAVLLYEDGRVALWDEGNRKTQWEFDKNGHLTKGLIPISSGGTGATDVASARKNLSVYSIQETNTELDKKASGSCFYDNAAHTGMQTRSKLYAVAVSDTGTFGAWDGQTQRYAFSFDKTGQLTNGVIPVARIAGLSEIGVNQSWVDVTKQRALNTAYTNSTSKPIFVSATCKLQTKLTSIELWIGGVKASTYYKDSNSDSAVCAIVPAGANYTIRATEGDILTWAELR
ncbi:hypothetical protein [Providencia rettgeri]|uniref:hypothetical protein n=1 Tax=Providencia rettgeri TaxID=587 RepID=UPI000D88C054|nr:hypothetical protein [Providencia rettgeri]PYZ58674.1 hypothetical protein DNK63_05875 [Providencia rettgeri]